MRIHCIKSWMKYPEKAVITAKYKDIIEYTYDNSY